MARVSSSGSGSWLDHLPFVLLGMRTSVREDSLCSPAEMLYGAPLRLPGDCFLPSEPVPLASTFASNLRSVLAAAAPMPVLHHGVPPSRVDPALQSATHVFLRVDAVRRPLVPPYLGPFAVLEKNEKTFLISQNGKNITVSIDRLKPANVLPDSASTPSPPVSRSPPRTVTVPRRPRPVSRPSPAVPDLDDADHFPPLRSGRVPRPVRRFQA